MLIGEVMVDTDHSVVLVRFALVGGDQVPGSVPIVCPIRQWKQVEELLYARINCEGNAPVRSGVVAGPRAIGRRQQALMGKRVGHSGDGCGRLHFTEPLVICKKERAVMHQWPTNSST